MTAPTKQQTLLKALVSHFDHEFSQCEELLTAGIDTLRPVIVKQGMEKLVRESGHDSPINGPLDNP